MRGFRKAALVVAAVGLPLAGVAGEAPNSRNSNIVATTTCENEQHLQVTIGLPADYLTVLGREAGQKAAIAQVHKVCAAVATGSPYQLLSWLENGAVQAAVLSSFAVSVMKADDPGRFKRDYFELPRSALTSLPNLERRLLIIFNGGEVTNPDASLADFFTAVRQHERVNMILPSHLSPAVPLLIRRATAWAEQQELDSTRRETFYTDLLAAISFGPTPEAHAGPPHPVYEIVDTLVEPSPGAISVMRTADNQLKPNVATHDLVVVRKRVLLASRSLREVVAAAVNETPESATHEDPKPVPLFAETPELEMLLGPTLTEFRLANYRRLQYGYVSQRHFRFTIPELWAQLQRDDTTGDTPPSERGRLALVLTGGGVKAAYQTRMIDYLYDEKRLVNGDKEPRKAGTQQVNYVIGTSGGALLGVFVAAMDEALNAKRQTIPQNRLTAILWKEPGDGIRSYDVFPFLDMMRYATLIVALLVVWMVAGFALEVFRKQFSHVTRIDHSEESFFGRRARAWKESWPWMLLLLFAPIIIVKVANANRVEHMPTETGLYYAWMALVAFYSDVRLSPTASFEWLKARFTPRTIIATAVGLACIAASLLFRKPLQDMSLDLFEKPGVIAVNLCCLGFVVLIHAVHLFFHDQKQFFTPQPRRPIFGAFFVLLGIVLLSYLGVLLAMAVQATSLLEMNSGFWLYFLSLAALLTVALMVLGRAGAVTRVSAWAKGTVCYLFSEYRSRALFGSERRFMRFMTLTVSAWLWWNLLAAPALYGNANARAFLRCAFENFATLADSNWKGKSCKEEDDEKDPGVPFPLAVPFVITATSLEKGQERYFLFVSGDDKDIDNALSHEAWFNVVRDPRWVVVRKPFDKELKDAAFASGSPFPVFSAHDVKLRSLKNKDRLIDGGFAHNKPLEAALALGANKVLVLNSSPLEDAAAGARCSLMAFDMGELACNLPKLLPYLWERSQVEDLLSTRSMLVASIYPTAASGVWPSLTDFRQEIVQGLVSNADGDKFKRVGVIESWGAPGFDSVNLFAYDTDQIKTAIRQSEE
jgi:predicted acylesterase/phospholipase RssA